MGGQCGIKGVMGGWCSTIVGAKMDFSGCYCMHGCWKVNRPIFLTEICQIKGGAGIGVVRNEKISCNQVPVVKKHGN